MLGLRWLWEKFKSWNGEGFDVIESVRRHTNHQHRDGDPSTGENRYQKHILHSAPPYKP
jgi:hypothetical protein